MLLLFLLLLSLGPVYVSFEVVDGLLGCLAILVRSWSRDAINNDMIADLGARVGIAKHSIGVIAHGGAGTDVSREASSSGSHHGRRGC